MPRGGPGLGVVQADWNDAMAPSAAPTGTDDDRRTTYETEASAGARRRIKEKETNTIHQLLTVQHARTALFAAGVSAEDIKAMGRWSSDVYRIYCRLSKERLLRLSRRMSNSRSAQFLNGADGFLSTITPAGELDLEEVEQQEQGQPPETDRDEDEGGDGGLGPGSDAKSDDGSAMTDDEGQVEAAGMCDCGPLLTRKSTLARQWQCRSLWAVTRCTSKAPSLRWCLRRLRLTWPFLASDHGWSPESASSRSSLWPPAAGGATTTQLLQLEDPFASEMTTMR